VNSERIQVVLFSQAAQLLALRKAGLIGAPPAWAGRKDLKGIAAQAIGAFGGVVYASGDRGVNANAPRRVPRRSFRRRLEQDVAFGLQGRVSRVRYSVFGIRFSVFGVSALALGLWFEAQILRAEAKPVVGSIFAASRLFDASRYFTAS
jgi:hypothetical protein